MDEYPVDMNVLSIEENETYDGQVRRVLVMATIDDVVERIQDAIRG